MPAEDFVDVVTAEVDALAGAANVAFPVAADSVADADVGVAAALAEITAGALAELTSAGLVASTLMCNSRHQNPQADKLRRTSIIGPGDRQTLPGQLVLPQAIN